MTQAGRQRVGIGLIILGLLLIIIIVYFAFFKKSTSIIEKPIDLEKQTPNIEELVNTTPSDIPRDNIKYDISKEEEHLFNATDLEKRAKSFAERFGSYSNQSDYSNFTELEIFMTKDFIDWTKTYVTELKGIVPDFSSYYGISTQALTANVLEFDKTKDTAKVYILTERSESTEDGLGTESYRQGITLNFMKINKDWLVDAAYWDKR